jgi:hypothetical protein
MYLQKLMSKKKLDNFFFVGVLKVTDEKSRIRIGLSEVRIPGSRSVPKCQADPAYEAVLNTLGKN